MVAILAIPTGEGEGVRVGGIEGVWNVVGIVEVMVEGLKKTEVGSGELVLLICCHIWGSVILVTGSRAVEQDNSSGASWKSSCDV